MRKLWELSCVCLECVKRLSGVREKVVQSAWAHVAEPMRRACEAYVQGRDRVCGVKKFPFL